MWLVLWARHEKSPEVYRRGGGTLRYTLSRKHESTYLHNREKKLDINDSAFSVSLPLSTSASLLSLSVTRTCTNTQHVEDLKWVCICETGIMFSTSIVRMRIVTVPSHIWDLKSSPENNLNRPPVSPMWDFKFLRRLLWRWQRSAILRRVV
jgi:hypothetical protein